jgi:hypothetical protein
MKTLPEALNSFGVKWTGVPGWEARTRPYARKWEGVMGHHTAMNLRRVGEQRQIDVCVKGRSTVPGPLYNILVGRDTAYILAAGYCNHAGRGMSEVLNLTKKGIAPSGPARSAGDMTGNAYYFSVSLMNDGVEEPLYSTQVDAFVGATAAVLRLNGWGAERYVAHKEWTSRKVDPREDFRELIAERLMLFEASQAPPPNTPVSPGPQFIRMPNAVASESSPRGGAYLLGSDGGIFTARGPNGIVPPFFGSIPGLREQGVALPHGVSAVDMAVTPRGGGYWILTSDGGVFSFGDAKFSGSAHGKLRDRKVTGIHTAERGYWITTNDPETLFTFP